MSLVELLTKAYQELPKSDFAFDCEQIVRVKKSLDVDTHAIKDLLGIKGIVSSRYVTGIHKDNKYVVRFPNGREETFDETELDYRYIKHGSGVKKD